MSDNEATSLVPMVLILLALVVIAGLAAVPAWHVLNMLLTGAVPAGTRWAAAGAGLAIVAGSLGLAWTRFRRMLERARQRQAGKPDDQAEAETEPLGTVFLLVVYVILIVGMWGTIYWMLLTR